MRKQNIKKSKKPSLGSLSLSSTSLWVGQFEAPISRPLVVPKSVVPSNLDFTRPGGFQKSLQFGMILMNILCLEMLFSLFAPFFPKEAGKKGMSPTVVGILFGIFEFVMFVQSPIWGIYISKIGFRFLAASGVFLAGGAAILFGLLDQAPDGSVYISLCFACRIIEATGTSMYTTAAYAYCSYLYPDDVAFMYGVMETVTGVGLMIGPAAGGLLYKAGGFILPFLTIGAVILVVGAFSFLFVTTCNEKTSPSTLSPLLLFKMPLVIIFGLCEAICAMSFAFLDPTFAIFLNGIGVTDPAVVGLIFMICCAAFAVCALITGKVVDKWNVPHAFMLLGSGVSCLGYLLLGPSPIVPVFEPTMVSVIIASVVTFAGLGFLLIPIPKLIAKALYDYGFPNDFETNALVSGVYNSLWSFGSFIGPTFAGVMVENIGFLWSSTIMGLFAGFVCLLLFVTVLVMRRVKNIRNLTQQAHGSRFTNPFHRRNSIEQGKEADESSELFHFVKESSNTVASCQSYTSEYGALHNSLGFYSI